MSNHKADVNTAKRQSDQLDLPESTDRGRGPGALAATYLFFVLLHLIGGGEYFAAIYAVSAMFWAFMTGDYFSRYRKNRRRSTLVAAIVFGVLFVASTAAYLTAFFAK